MIPFLVLCYTRLRGKGAGELLSIKGINEKRRRNVDALRRWMVKDFFQRVWKDKDAAFIHSRMAALPHGH